MMRTPTTLSGCLKLALCGYLLAILCIHLASGQTMNVTNIPGDGAIFNATWTNKTLTFCWWCSTSSAAGPWFPCSDTQTVSRTGTNSVFFSTPLHNIPSNTPNFFVIQQAFNP
jgi:hypothetical protein